MQCVIWQQMYSYRPERENRYRSLRERTITGFSLTQNYKLITIVIVIQMSVRRGRAFSCVCTREDPMYAPASARNILLCASSAGQLEFPLFTFSAIRLMLMSIRR